MTIACLFVCPQLLPCWCSPDLSPSVNSTSFLSGWHLHTYPQLYSPGFGIQDSSSPWGLSQCLPPVSTAPPAARSSRRREEAPGRAVCPARRARTPPFVGAPSSENKRSTEEQRRQRAPHSVPIICRPTRERPVLVLQRLYKSSTDAQEFSTH